MTLCVLKLVEKAFMKNVMYMIEQCLLKQAYFHSYAEWHVFLQSLMYNHLLH